MPIESPYDTDERGASSLPGSEALGGAAQRQKHKGLQTLSVVLAAAAILGIYLLRIDDVVGQFKDDGWYVVLAQSLASGKGYNLVNLPQHSGLYFYPPFFPLLLSLFYRIWPTFPANVYLLKSLSIVSMFLLSALVFRIFKREDRLPRSLAFLLAFAVAVAPSFVMLATSSLMSECMFTLLQFATLWSAERCLNRPAASSRLGITFITALEAAAAYLTRAIGVALILALAADLLKTKRFQRLAVFVAAMILGLAPWLVYKHLRVINATASGPIVAGYSEQFWSRLAGSSHPVRVTPRGLVARVWQMSTVIVGADIGGLLVPSLYRSGSESGEEITSMTAVIPGVSRNAIGLSGVTMGLSVSAQLISLCLSLVVLVGLVTSLQRGVGAGEFIFFFSLVIIVAWPWPPIRFLVPLLPFLLYYFLIGTAEIYRLLAKALRRTPPADRWAASRVMLLLIVGLYLYDNGLYIAATHANPTSWQYPEWRRQFNAVQQAERWIQSHTSESEVVAGDNLPVTYLYSGRHTDLCDLAECAQKGVRYYVKAENYDVSLPSRVVFQSRSPTVQVLDLSRSH